jgi:hypothetical protein
VHFRSEQVRTTHPRPGQRHLLTAPAPSRAICGVLGKFADLPHEAEQEIRGLDEARRRIAELEREIKRLKGSSAAPRIDHMAVDRAAKAAVERERAAWQRKLELGSARLKQMIGAGASTGQGFEKLKVLFGEAEKEWANPPAAIEAGDSSLSRRSDRTAKPANHRVASAKTLNGSLKLASGERRILTSLAQYPEGRSKVQVAVLTGHAATGGGFNNYLGALRSRGLVEGDGDRLTITEAANDALGSWEPLPAGPALIDYWRGRLGKAERLILETLTDAYPGRLTKEEVAAKAGHEPNGGGFNNALGRLRTLELVHGRRGELTANSNLFDPEN